VRGLQGDWSFVGYCKHVAQFVRPAVEVRAAHFIGQSPEANWRWLSASQTPQIRFSVEERV